MIDIRQSFFDDSSRYQLASEVLFASLTLGVNETSRYSLNFLEVWLHIPNEDLETYGGMSNYVVDLVLAFSHGEFFSHADARFCLHRACPPLRCRSFVVQE